jgi:hypothetical protein
MVNRVLIPVERRRQVLFWALVAILVGALVAGALHWLYWNQTGRYRPVTLTRNLVEIQRMLDQGGWVSPGGDGPPVYLVGYRSCEACIAYQRDAFVALDAANIDTRVLVFARADLSGFPLSSPAERTTVAELWFNRDWTLYTRWMATPAKAWTAPGLIPADTDVARTAAVRGAQAYVDRLHGLLSDAGVSEGYPLLIWRDPRGRLKACACFDPTNWPQVRGELIADVKTQAVPQRGLASAPAGAQF